MLHRKNQEDQHHQNQICSQAKYWNVSSWCCDAKFALVLNSLDRNEISMTTGPRDRPTHRSCAIPSVAVSFWIFTVACGCQGVILVRGIGKKNWGERFPSFGVNWNDIFRHLGVSIFSDSSGSLKDLGRRTSHEEKRAVPWCFSSTLWNHVKTNPCEINCRIHNSKSAEFVTFFWKANTPLASFGSCGSCGNLASSSSFQHWIHHRRAKERSEHIWTLSSWCHISTILSYHCDLWTAPLWTAIWAAIGCTRFCRLRLRRRSNSKRWVILCCWAKGCSVFGPKQHDLSCLAVKLTCTKWLHLCWLSGICRNSLGAGAQYDQLLRRPCGRNKTNDLQQVRSGCQVSNTQWFWSNGYGSGWFSGESLPASAVSVSIIFSLLFCNGNGL